MILGGCIDLIGYLISGIPKIFVRCRNVEEVIGSIVLNFLLYFLHLEVHCFRLKGDISCDIGDGLTGIVEDSVEHFARVYVHC